MHPQPCRSLGIPTEFAAPGPEIATEAQRERETTVPPNHSSSLVWRPPVPPLRRDRTEGGPEGNNREVEAWPAARGTAPCHSRAPEGSDPKLEVATRSYPSARTGRIPGAFRDRKPGETVLPTEAAAHSKILDRTGGGAAPRRRESEERAAVLTGFGCSNCANTTRSCRLPRTRNRDTSSIGGGPALCAPRWPPPRTTPCLLVWIPVAP